jgi:Ion channel
MWSMRKTTPPESDRVASPSVIAVNASSDGTYVAGQIVGLAALGVGIWAYFGTKRRVWLVAVVVAFFAASTVAAWVDQFHLLHRAPSVTYTDISPIVIVAIAIALLIVLRFHPFWTTLLVLYVFSELLLGFSHLYWNYGGGGNFSRPLSHLDSLYLAVGTLSTAGSGNISALTETAKRIQTVQMFVDLPLTLFAVAAVIAGLSAHVLNRTGRRQVLAEPLETMPTGANAPTGSLPEALRTNPSTRSSGPMSP